MITNIAVDTAMSGCGEDCPIIEIVEGPDIYAGDGQLIKTFRCKHLEACEYMNEILTRDNK